MHGQYRIIYLTGMLPPRLDYRAREQCGLHPSSSLGRFDGRVYEDMFNRAHRLNPLNKLTFNPDYRTEEIVMGSGDGGKILSKL